MSAQSASDLIKLAYRYYPRRPDYEREARIEAPEWNAFSALWDQKMLEHGKWFDFRKRLQADLPGCGVGDWTVPRGTASFRSIIYRKQPRPKNGVFMIVVGCASILAPYYFAYRTERHYTNGETSQITYSFNLGGDAALPAKMFAKHMESTYRFSPFPSEWIEIIVPDIALSDEVQVGQVTLRDAFFTHGWYKY